MREKILNLPSDKCTIVHRTVLDKQNYDMQANNEVKHNEAAKAG